MTIATDSPQETAMTGFGKVPTYKSELGSTFIVAEDKQSFAMLFDNFELEAPPAKSLALTATRLLQLAIPLEVTTGVEIGFYIEGHVATEEGATATLVFSVNGQSIVADFPGNSDTDYVQELKLKAATASECRLGVLLMIGRDSKTPNWQGYINATSIGATIQPSTKP
jgi:hypothetical protein